MGAYLIRRSLLAILTMLVLSLLSFVIIEVPPGNAVDSMIGIRTESARPVTAAEEALMRRDMGLDKPLLVRYGMWMWGLLHADLGHAFMAFGSQGYGKQRPVEEVIKDRVWTTVALMGATILFTWTLSIPIGIYSAVRQHSIGDYAFTFLGFTGLAVPDFLLGLVLLYVALAYFDQSVGGLFSTEFEHATWSFPRVWDLIKHLWIPAIVLGTSGTASLIRIMRNNLLDELNKPYVVTALAKGMSPWRAIIKYPVRVTINPLVSTAGYLLPFLVGGSVIVSLVLGLPTVGPVLLHAIQFQDVHTGASILLILGILTVVGTLLSDILLAVVDPRIRFGRR